MPIAREPEAPAGHTGHLPMRTCIGCRVSSAQGDLLRLQLVAKHEGGVDRRVVEPAISRRGRSGRGAYLCPRRSCLDQAIKRRAFTRAFSPRHAAPGTLAGVESVDSSAAEALWTSAIAQVRRELELSDRSDRSSSQPRRRGLERLLSELSVHPVHPSALLPNRPTPPDRRPRSNGQGGTSTHG
jgi:predicted RNA-binding protein YlxR (DUF448 family)